MREINLLPPLRRTALRRQGFTADMQSVLWSLMIALIAIMCLGVGSYIVLWSLGAFVFRSDMTELSAALEEYKDLRVQIENQNQQLRALADAGNNRLIFSDELRGILGVLPLSTTIEQVSGTAAIQSTPTISISGQGQNRTALVVLREKLQQLEGVTSVSAPTTILLERVSPTYRFDLTLTPPTSTEESEESAEEISNQ